jgi:hypothetical protein
MNIAKGINEEVWKLWEDTFKNDDDVYVPLIYPDLEPKTFLFVGSNPSFSVKGYLRFLKGEPKYSDIKPEQFFNWNARDKFDYKKAQGIEEEAREKYFYFQPFRKITEEITGDYKDWNHVDLFFYRETSQNSLKEKVYPQNQLSPFGRKQLDLSKRLIIEARPKIIVVVNAFASKLFIEEVFEEMSGDIDAKLGYHLLQFDGRDIPVFLASMLTGQRAMDVYSRQRLEWHIKKGYESFCELF